MIRPSAHCARPVARAFVRVFKTDNTRARRYADALRSATPMVIATGPAGCGKTLGACEYALEALRTGEVHRVVVTRPLIPVDGEELGHLPGDLDQKMRPWAMPVWDQLSACAEPRELDALVREARITVEPLGMMRGRTFDHALVIGDEMQNASVNQMRMLLTRVGKSSRVVITGDESQRDLAESASGLSDLVRRLSPEDDMGVIVRFETEDARRSAFVRAVLQLYERDP